MCPFISKLAYLLFHFIKELFIDFLPLLSKSSKKKIGVTVGIVSTLALAIEPTYASTVSQWETCGQLYGQMSVTTHPIEGLPVSLPSHPPNLQLQKTFLD